jgi:hypothetical protein
MVVGARVQRWLHENSLKKLYLLAAASMALRCMVSVEIAQYWRVSHCKCE